MLPSFEIRRFRTFSHLRIERLGHVNLIMGRNNVGKSMLLEALRLYATGKGGRLRAIQTLLTDCDEVISTPDSGEGASPRVKSLLHRGTRGAEGNGEIQFGPISNAQATVRIIIKSSAWEANGAASQRLRVLAKPQRTTHGLTTSVTPSRDVSGKGQAEGLSSLPELIVTYGQSELKEPVPIVGVPLPGPL
jgi:hypothetical protein